MCLGGRGAFWAKDGRGRRADLGSGFVGEGRRSRKADGAKGGVVVWWAKGGVVERRGVVKSVVVGGWRDCDWKELCVFSESREVGRGWVVTES